MGQLTEDMTNLRSEIDALRNGRLEFIAGLKHGLNELKSDVVDMQADLRQNRTQMAGKLKDDLRGFIAETEAYVSNLKDGVADRQENFRRDHADMSRKLKNDLNVFAAGITSSVDGLLALFREERVEMAGNMKDDLQVFRYGIEKYIADLKHEVFNFQESFRGDHVEMARKLREDLEMFAAGISSGVSDLVKKFRNEQIETTRKSRAERRMFISNMKQLVADLKRQISDLLHDRSDDLAGAHWAWSGAASSPAGERAVEKVPEPVGMQAEPEMAGPPAEVHAEPDQVELPVKDQAAQESRDQASLKVSRQTKAPAKPDDLTQLRGIGPALSKRLNDVGIFTFSKLASCTVEELRNGLGESAKFAGFEKWIKQAKEWSD